MCKQRFAVSRNHRNRKRVEVQKEGWEGFEQEREDDWLNGGEERERERKTVFGSFQIPHMKNTHSPQLGFYFTCKHILTSVSLSLIPLSFQL